MATAECRIPPELHFKIWPSILLLFTKYYIIIITSWSASFDMWSGLNVLPFHGHFVGLAIDAKCCLISNRCTTMALKAAYSNHTELKLTLQQLRETVMLVLLTWGIYYIRQWCGFRWHDIHTKFHKDRLRLSKVVKRIHIQTHTHTHSKVLS
jgi:hypothetical protein